MVRQRNGIANNKNRVRRQRDDIDYKSKAINQKIKNIYSDVYQILDKKQKEIEKELAGYDKPLQKLLQSVPGVGSVTAASFVSEVVDINRFKHPKHLTAYIGIDPMVHESGTSIKGKGYITKRGSKISRTILYNAATVAVQRDNMFRDNMFREFFQKKRSEGKLYRVALIATMKKMAHVIHAVWTRGTPFVN